MENSTFTLSPRTETIEFLKHFARECPLLPAARPEKMIVLQLSKIEPLGSC